MYNGLLHSKVFDAKGEQIALSDLEKQIIMLRRDMAKYRKAGLLTWVDGDFAKSLQHLRIAALMYKRSKRAQKALLHALVALPDFAGFGKLGFSIKTYTPNDGILKMTIAPHIRATYGLTVKRVNPFKVQYGVSSKSETGGAEGVAAMRAFECLVKYAKEAEHRSQLRLHTMKAMKAQHDSMRNNKSDKRCVPTLIINNDIVLCDLTEPYWRNKTVTPSHNLRTYVAEAGRYAADYNTLITEWTTTELFVVEDERVFLLNCLADVAAVYKSAAIHLMKLQLDTLEYIKKKGWCHNMPAASAEAVCRRLGDGVDFFYGAATTRFVPHSDMKYGAIEDWLKDDPSGLSVVNMKVPLTGVLAYADSVNDRVQTRDFDDGRALVARYKLSIL